MRNTGLNELQTEIKIGGGNIGRWYYSNDKKQRGSKEPLDEGEGGEWKSWIKEKKTPKILASGPITTWQTDGEKVEVVTDFLFLDSKITMDGD